MTKELKTGNPNNLVFREYPRQFGRNRAVVKTKESFYDKVNEFNGKTAVYGSIYSCNKRNKFDDVNLNSLYFDFDEAREGFKATREFHKHLVEENIKHIVVHSGSGMNVHVASKDFDDRKFPARDVLSNAQNGLLLDCFGKKRYRELIGKEADGESKKIIDKRVIGDKARICRVLNTFNVKEEAQRFAIPLKKEDIVNGWEAITDKAQSQVSEWHVFGDEPVDLREYDEEKRELEFVEMEFDAVDLDEVDTDDDWFDMFPPVVQKLLVNNKSGWFDRYLTILAMKEVGLPVNLTKEITKKYWTTKREHHGRVTTDWEHAVKDERQFRYVYNRDNLLFPEMSTLMTKGYPVDKEDKQWRKQLYR